MAQTRVGEQIRERRELLGLSLREAAKLSGGEVGHSTWGQIENGSMNPTISMLEAIAKTIGMEIDLQLTQSRDQLTPERRALLDRLSVLLDKLQDRDVRALLAQLEAYERESSGA